MVSGFVGARLLHVLYEQPQYYINSPVEILKFWRGGFVFFGGAIGALVATAVYIRIKKMIFLKWADLFAPVFALGYAIGRFGCFLNGCCFGAQCDLPWAVQFPSHQQHYSSLVDRHPTQIYTLLIELIILFGILSMEKIMSSYNHDESPSDKNRLKLIFSKWFQPAGQIFFLWGTLHGVNRFFMEFFRDDFRGSEILNLSISSWISILIILTASHFLFHNGRKFVSI
jgi:phosphatidylglycerol---prolipoprotein diacylglyceryl transferase